MTYDIIKLLNLEDFNINLLKSDVYKYDGIMYCSIVLTVDKVACASCGSTNIVIKDYREKTITHSVLTSSPFILKYKARRFTCKDCGKIFYENNPFSDNNDKVSTMTKIFVLDALRSHTSTFTSVAKEYNLTPQTVINIFDNWVECKRKVLPSIICIDEIYTSKLSNSSKYACVLLDFQTKEIVEIYSSRQKFYLANRFTEISNKERENVSFIIIDMWISYKELARLYFKNALIAVDSFHIISHLNKAMDKVRLRVMRKFEKPSSKLINNDMYYYMLKKFHYFFTKNYEDISNNVKVHKINSKWTKDETLKYLLSISDELKLAYYLKEKYREFNLTAEYETCDEELDELIKEFCNCPISEFREFGKMIRSWTTEIKNSFIRIPVTTKTGTIYRRLSNGAMEGTNSRLKCIIKNANGYGNFVRFKNRCMFAINKSTPILGVPKNKQN